MRTDMENQQYRVAKPKMDLNAQCLLDEKKTWLKYISPELNIAEFIMRYTVELSWVMKYSWTFEAKRYPLQDIDPRLIFFWFETHTHTHKTMPDCFPNPLAG